tara:strand:+ start:439 stop:930 length:492 start_codon:yes stop_codon:yes gene_type:complete
MEILPIVPTKAQVKRAEKMAAEMGQLRNSITRGKGNIIGFLGEIVLADHFGWEQANTYDYDLVLPNGKTVDVKSKQCRSIPRPEYECSISSYNTKQACDYYAFTRIKSDYSVLWFCGVMPKELYFNLATKKHKGETDPSNGFTFRSDCYNLLISDLKGTPEND